MNDKIALDSLDESLRETARRLVAAGATVHVNPWRDGRPSGHFYVTKPDQPGIVIVNIADFPRLGQPPTLSIPVKPNRTWGSGVLLDVPRDKTIVDTVLGALARGNVTPRFVGPASPVPVDHRIPDTARELTLED